MVQHLPSLCVLPPVWVPSLSSAQVSSCLVPLGELAPPAPAARRTPLASANRKCQKPAGIMCTWRAGTSLLP